MLVLSTYLSNTHWYNTHTHIHTHTRAHFLRGFYFGWIMRMCALELLSDVSAKNILVIYLSLSHTLTHKHIPTHIISLSLRNKLAYTHTHTQKHTHALSLSWLVFLMQLVQFELVSRKEHFCVTKKNFVNGVGVGLDRYHLVNSDLQEKYWWTLFSKFGDFNDWRK